MSGKTVMNAEEKTMNAHQDLATIDHRQATIAELRANPDFAAEYLNAALDELDGPDAPGSGLLALRDIVEAYGGMSAVARQAGLTREALYRALSANGNPTLKTLLAVLRALDLRLRVGPADHT